MSTRVAEHSDAGRGDVYDVLMQRDAPREPTPVEVAISVGFTAFLMLAYLVTTASVTLDGSFDFAPSYMAARMVRSGDAALLYDMGAQASYQAALFHRPTPLPFLHPPFEAAGLALLGWLSYRNAYLAWGVFSVGLWIALAVFMRRHFPAPRQILRYYLVWFAFVPLWISLMQGQTSLLVLLALSFAFIFLRDGRDLEAGACLAIGLVKFHFVVPFALIFLLARRWKVAAGLALTGIFLVAGSSLVLGGGVTLSYVRLLLTVPRTLAFGAFHPHDMANLAGMAHGTLDRFVSARGIEIAVAVLSILVIIAASRVWRRPGATFEACFGASVAASVLVSFSMNAHDLAPLLLPFLLALQPAMLLATRKRAILSAGLILYLAPLLWALQVAHLFFIVGIVSLVMFAAFVTTRVADPQVARHSNAWSGPT